MCGYLRHPSQLGYDFLKPNKLNVKTIFAQKNQLYLLEIDENVRRTIYFPQFHSSTTLSCSKHFQIMLPLLNLHPSH
jgi:hypothetical protein